MKIHRKPCVYLLGRSTLQGEALAQFLKDHQFENWTTESPCDPQTLIEVAARNCYQSFQGGRPHQEHLEHILEVGHGSVLEHAVWQFLVTGVSRSLTHELVRHRAGWAYSQLSQRYVDESVAEYVEPDMIAEDPDLHALWMAAMRFAHSAYKELAERLANRLDKHTVTEFGYMTPGGKTERRKFARQAARSVLPNATETKIFCTANARALRHFLEMRGSRHAEPEIRKLANALHELLLQEAKDLFGDYTRVPLPDGTYELQTPHKKV